MKGILFDLDGTLIDSMYIWKIVDKLYIEYKGLKYDPAISLKLKEAPLSETIKIFSEHYNYTVDFSDFDNYVDDLLLRYYGYEFKLKNNVLEKLRELKENNFKMAITTATPSKYVNPLIKRLNLNKYMDFILTPDIININKNNELFFKTAVKMLGTDYKDTYVFDDAIYALKNAKKLKLISVGIYDESNNDDIKKIKSLCDIFLKDFSELKIKNGKIIK